MCLCGKNINPSLKRRRFIIFLLLLLASTERPKGHRLSPWSLQSVIYNLHHPCVHMLLVKPLSHKQKASIHLWRVANVVYISLRGIFLWPQPAIDFHLAFTLWLLFYPFNNNYSVTLHIFVPVFVSVFPVISSRITGHPCTAVSDQVIADGRRAST